MTFTRTVGLLGTLFCVYCDDICANCRVTWITILWNSEKYRYAENLLAEVSDINMMRCVCTRVRKRLSSKTTPYIFSALRK